MLVSLLLFPCLKNFDFWFTFLFVINVILEEHSKDKFKKI